MCKNTAPWVSRNKYSTRLHHIYASLKLPSHAAFAVCTCSSALTIYNTVFCISLYSQLILQCMYVCTYCMTVLLESISLLIFGYFCTLLTILFYNLHTYVIMVCLCKLLFAHTYWFHTYGTRQNKVNVV